MNNPHTQLKDLIHIERGIIPANICDHVIQDIETREWKPHTWYTSASGSFGSEETMELDVQYSTSELQKELDPFIIKAGLAYEQKYSYPSDKTKEFMSKFSLLKFNRYSSGQIMRQHHDHIRSLFDGFERGIPVFSLILNLNDDYEGADLFFWKDYVVPLGKGDIIMFPSLFLFPHGVTEATKGKRYSAASWAW